MKQEEREEREKHLGETFGRILRQTTARALLRSSGKQPIDLRPEEIEALTEPFNQAIASDQLMCLELARQFYALGFAAAARSETSEQGDDAGAELELHSHAKP